MLPRGFQRWLPAHPAGGLRVCIPAISHGIIGETRGPGAVPEDAMIAMRQFAPNEDIIKENESGETAFIIEKGRVEISKEKGGKRVHIAYLEKGSTFGEMSMVDDLPRSATVTAVEETLVRELHRDDLYSAMQQNPEATLKFLKSIFERLREANMTIARIASEGGGSGAPRPKEPSGKQARFLIEGLTPQASAAISSSPFAIGSFPFKVGRKSGDPMVSNHLEITDHAPYQVSRHHVSLIRDGDRIGVVDRGSHLGALVDGARIGGPDSAPGPVFFTGGEGVLVLGTDISLYRYRIKPLT